MVNKGQKLLAAGAAIAIAEPALAAAHGGPIGVIVGGAIGLATYVYADDLAKLVGRDTSSLPTSKPKKPGQFGMFYRLTHGKSTRRREQDEQDIPTDGDEPEEEQELNGLIQLAHNLQVPLLDIAGKAILIVGMRRSGKTTLAALLTEQLGP